MINTSLNLSWTTVVQKVVVFIRLPQSRTHGLYKTYNNSVSDMSALVVPSFLDNISRSWCSPNLSQIRTTVFYWKDKITLQ